MTAGIFFTALLIACIVHDGLKQIAEAIKGKGKG
jgi:hypothetical protein